MIPGQITLRATALALTCIVGAAPISGSNILGAFPLNQSVDQDGRKADAANSPHQYTPLSVMKVCGAIPYIGFEGYVNSEIASWKCDDGANLHAAVEGFTSFHAAEAERMARLRGEGKVGKPWKIAHTDLIDGATIVELAEPVTLWDKEAASSQWVVMWAREASLFLIYGPDREHVMDFYQTRYGESAKK
jgi:hypothetical protein